MYRLGLTAPQIAATVNVGKSTVRYHLAIAAKAEPSIRDEHRNAARAALGIRTTEKGLQNLHDTLTLYRAERRLPSTKSPSTRERTLAIWLLRRRHDHARGTLSPTYSNALQKLPDWELTRTSKDEARWTQRLHDTTTYIAAGNDWPRHKNTETEEERLLGTWLHTQRIKSRRTELAKDKEDQLDTLLPGWRNGRTRGRPPGSANGRLG